VRVDSRIERQRGERRSISSLHVPQIEQSLVQARLRLAQPRVLRGIARTVGQAAHGLLIAHQTRARRTFALLERVAHRDVQIPAQIEPTALEFVDERAGAHPLDEFERRGEFAPFDPQRDRLVVEVDMTAEQQGAGAISPAPPRAQPLEAIGGAVEVGERGVTPSLTAQQRRAHTQRLTSTSGAASAVARIVASRWASASSCARAIVPIASARARPKRVSAVIQ
jgi:hypothetical protein